MAGRAARAELLTFCCKMLKWQLAGFMLTLCWSHVPVVGKLLWGLQHCFSFLLQDLPWEKREDVKFPFAFGQALVTYWNQIQSCLRGCLPNHYQHFQNSSKMGKSMQRRNPNPQQTLPRAIRGRQCHPAEGLHLPAVSFDQFDFKRGGTLEVASPLLRTLHSHCILLPSSPTTWRQLG